MAARAERQKPEAGAAADGKMKITKLHHVESFSDAVRMGQIEISSQHHPKNLHARDNTDKEQTEQSLLTIFLRHASRGRTDVPLELLDMMVL